MTTTHGRPPVWVLEFTAPSHGEAIGMIRKHAPDGGGAWAVQKTGRLDFQVRSADFGWISGLCDGIASAGGITILEEGD
jgi:hypothetical protein